MLVWGLGYSQRVRNGLCLQGHFSGVSNPFLYTCCWHARLVTRDFSPMFLRLAVPVTVMYLFQFSKKILTLDLKQDPPPHPNTLRLQRMIRYSATLFVQVKPCTVAETLHSPPLLFYHSEGRLGQWLVYFLFVHLLLFKVINVSVTSRGKSGCQKK